jgi:hypothetical protein
MNSIYINNKSMEERHLIELVTLARQYLEVPPSRLISEWAKQASMVPNTRHYVFIDDETLWKTARQIGGSNIGQKSDKRIRINMIRLINAIAPNSHIDHTELFIYGIDNARQQSFWDVARNNGYRVVTRTTMTNSIDSKIIEDMRDVIAKVESQIIRPKLIIVSNSLSLVPTIKLANAKQIGTMVAFWPTSLLKAWYEVKKHEPLTGIVTLSYDQICYINARSTQNILNTHTSFYVLTSSGHVPVDISINDFTAELMRITPFEFYIKTYHGHLIVEYVCRKDLSMDTIRNIFNTKIGINWPISSGLYFYNVTYDWITTIEQQ